MTIAAVSFIMISAQITDRSTHAPTFDVMGSLFPAWLACLAAAIFFTIGIRWLLITLRIPLIFPVLTYPCLTALGTFSLWLALFR